MSCAIFNIALSCHACMYEMTIACMHVASYMHVFMILNDSAILYIANMQCILCMHVHKELILYNYS